LTGSPCLTEINLGFARLTLEDFLCAWERMLMIPKIPWRASAPAKKIIDPTNNRGAMDCIDWETTRSYIESFDGRFDE